jgi:hypothetical protein
MNYGRLLSLSTWAMGGLFGLMIAAIVVDLAGPTQRTQGTILSTRFVEGVTTTIDVQVGDVTQPLRTEVPGAWLVMIESPVLGPALAPVSRLENLIELRSKVTTGAIAWLPMYHVYPDTRYHGRTVYSGRNAPKAL